MLSFDVWAIGRPACGYRRIGRREIESIVVEHPAWIFDVWRGSATMRALPREFGSDALSAAR